MLSKKGSLKAFKSESPKSALAFTLVTIDLLIKSMLTPLLFLEYIKFLINMDIFQGPYAKDKYLVQKVIVITIEPSK